jgi:polysaccharide export outer membrane protein
MAHKNSPLNDSKVAVTRPLRGAASLLFGLMVALAISTTHAATQSAPTPVRPSPAVEAATNAAMPKQDARRLAVLGAGDSVTIGVYGEPEMSSTELVAEDGTLNVALAGHVQVAGLSAVEAGERVEAALKKGQFMVDPHVTLTIAQSRTQRVVILGEVRTPGRYTIDPNSSITDLLAQAGGVTEKGADTAYVQRTDAQGNVTRLPLDLKGLSAGKATVSSVNLQGGDSVFVPRADQYYIYGEIAQPNMYRLEPGLTIIQAIARAGGVTIRGSERRIEIKRPSKDGKYVIIHPKPYDPIQADDVIRVKESIF